MSDPFDEPFPGRLEQLRAICPKERTLAGTVNNVMTYGAFVTSKLGFSGLAPWHLVGSPEAPIPRDRIDIGATVTVRISGDIALEQGGKARVPLSIVGLAS